MYIVELALIRKKTTTNSTTDSRSKLKNKAKGEEKETGRHKIDENKIQFLS